MSKKTIGLIINPISGMGGSLGYKGTDGADILKRIYSTGAKPISGARTSQALKEFSHLKNNIVLITCPNEMGENIARKFGFDVLVLNNIQAKNTTSNDTDENQINVADTTDATEIPAMQPKKVVQKNPTTSSSQEPLKYPYLLREILRVGMVSSIIIIILGITYTII